MGVRDMRRNNILSRPLLAAMAGFTLAMVSGTATAAETPSDQTALRIVPASASELRPQSDEAIAGDPARELRSFLKDAFAGFDRGERSWSTNIEYSGRIEQAHELSRSSSDGNAESAEFATVARLFGSGEFQPMLGFGFGDVGGRFEDARGEEGLALTGVVGGALRLSEQVGAVMKYGYTVATSGLEHTGGKDVAHGLQIGFEIRLN